MLKKEDFPKKCPVAFQWTQRACLQATGDIDEFKLYSQFKKHVPSPLKTGTPYSEVVAEGVAEFSKELCKHDIQRIYRKKSSNRIFESCLYGDLYFSLVGFEDVVARRKEKNEQIKLEL